MLAQAKRAFWRVDAKAGRLFLRLLRGALRTIEADRPHVPCLCATCAAAHARAQGATEGWTQPPAEARLR